MQTAKYNREENEANSTKSPLRTITQRTRTHHGNERTLNKRTKDKITKRKSNMSVGGDEPPDDKRQR
jgi:hypothetical protein